MREMKESGVEWIGKIPNSWASDKVKYHFSNTKRIVGTKVNEYQRLALTLKGVIKRSKDDNEGLQPSEFRGYQILKNGELVFKLIDLQNTATSRVGLSSYTGIVSPAYIVLNGKDSIVPSFAEKYFLSMWHRNIFNHLGDSGVRSNLNAQELLNVSIAYPNITEQYKIADFLDQKCSEIDALTADIQTQIETLEEYKKSVITEAVTKGLDPNVEMKDSGVEWIGKIPKGWIIKKIRYVTTSISDIDHYMPSDSDDENSIPYLMIGDLKDRTSKVDFEQCKHISYIDYKYLSSKRKNQIDDVIFARYATIGTVTYIDTNRDFLVSYACLTIKTHENMYGKFLFYYFKSKSFLEDVSQYINSNTQGNVGKDSLARTKMVVPPINEQHLVADFLDQKCSEIDLTISEKQQQLETLAEYKKSLIYEYVTGKKEVA